MLGSPVFSLTPRSLSRRSDNAHVEIAARVVEELRAELGDDGSEFSDDGDDATKEEELTEGDVEEDYEFEFVTEKMAFSPISAEEAFCNGQIRAFFPVGRGNFLIGKSYSVAVRHRFFSSPQPAQAARLPLRKLFKEDRGTMSSCSSSEGEEMDCVPADTFCVWRPKWVTDKLSPGKCARWKFPDLLNRSSSDGKDAFVVLSSSLKKLMDKKLKKSTTIETLNPAGK